MNFLPPDGANTTPSCRGKSIFSKSVDSDSRQHTKRQYSTDRAGRDLCTHGRESIRWYAMDALPATGSHEVRGSMPLGSTNIRSKLGPPLGVALHRFVCL